MAQTFTSLTTHVVFSTKNRLPLIRPELRPKLLAYLGGIIKEFGGTAIAINGTTDHVHLLIRMPPAVAISDALRVVKTNSSRWAHENWRARVKFGWQTGYGAFSVSSSSIPAVVRYIVDQEEHHRKVSFQEEFLLLLKKHGISYDERYIWE